MTNVILKNTPKVKLANVIKRRKTTLAQFLIDAGVQSYSGLGTLCDRLGVQPPTLVEYDAIVKRPQVTSQQDGIVVIGPVETDDTVDESKKVVLVAPKKKSLITKLKNKKDDDNER